jgi:hypothetical protein
VYAGATKIVQDRHVFGAAHVLGPYRLPTSIWPSGQLPPVPGMHPGTASTGRHAVNRQGKVLVLIGHPLHEEQKTVADVTATPLCFVASEPWTTPCTTQL